MWSTPNLNAVLLGAAGKPRTLSLLLWCVPNLSSTTPVVYSPSPAGHWGFGFFFRFWFLYIYFFFKCMFVLTLNKGPQSCWGLWRMLEWKEHIIADHFLFRSPFYFILTYICTLLTHSSSASVYCDVFPLSICHSCFSVKRTDRLMLEFYGTLRVPLTEVLVKWAPAQLADQV